MIKLLKNKEVRKALLWQLLLSAAACAVCFFFDIRAGLTAAGLSLLLMLVFCISTYKRYQRISSLADDINQVLHGDSSIDFDSYSEGELSILHSEIYKMTIRLREQQQTLTREKAYLADSIADISHQIRTPLTSINLLIGLLSEPKLTDARRQQLIHELYELLSRIGQHFLRQRQHTANMVAAGQLRHHTAIGTVHFNLAVQRMAEQGGHALSIRHAHQGHAGFIAGGFDSEDQQTHGVQV